MTVMRLKVERASGGANLKKGNFATMLRRVTQPPVDALPYSQDFIGAARSKKARIGRPRHGQRVKLFSGPAAHDLGTRCGIVYDDVEAFGDGEALPIGRPIHVTR